MAGYVSYRAMPLPANIGHETPFHDGRVISRAR
jgi:hypothetical protein